MFIDRLINNKIMSSLQGGKVLLLIGARRVGKTILLKKIADEWPGEYLFWNGEDYAIQEMLQRRSAQHYRHLLGQSELLIIDEAHHIPQIGQILKLMVDSFPDLKVIISGSSAFEIYHETGEPLVGRKKTLKLFPLSERELISIEEAPERMDNLQQRLIYGNLPELQSMISHSDKTNYLRELINSYLFKDILSFERIRNSSKLFNLLKLIAFQVGSEVSLEELGRQLGMSKNTVERYLDLLSKTFVIYSLSGLSRNLRKEVTKSKKWYFFDNGVRNAIIANFAPWVLRNDIGKLWENYLVSERIKFQHDSGWVVHNYFWRTYDRQEIDWIEDRDGKLSAFEFKWNIRKVKPPRAWINSYPDAGFDVISQENYTSFVGINE